MMESILEGNLTCVSTLEEALPRTNQFKHLNELFNKAVTGNGLSILFKLLHR